MDMEKFEQFTRDVSRRGVLRSVFGVLAGAGVATGLLLDDAEAKKRRNSKKNGKGKGKGKGKGGKRRGRGGRGRGGQRAQVNAVPTPIEGNPTCEDLGFSTLSSFRVDPPNDGNRTVDIGDCDCRVTYDVSPHQPMGTELAFTSQCPVTTVLVKGGPRANRYNLEGAERLGASGLISPLNNGGNIPNISHFDFCGLQCPTCTPVCPDDFCGTGNCGQTCSCPDTQECEGSMCVDCTPTCPDDYCGDDGCGRTCACPGNQVCVDEQCEACVPNCPVGYCGDDGCGNDCTCPSGQTCDTENSQCEPDVCKPYCPKNYCGDDGCYGKCKCGDYQTCGYDKYCTPPL